MAYQLKDQADRDLYNLIKGLSPESFKKLQGELASLGFPVGQSVSSSYQLTNDDLEQARHELDEDYPEDGTEDEQDAYNAKVRALAKKIAKRHGKF